MKPIHLTEATFARTITEGNIVLVDFWAAWCGPCLQFAPVFDAAAAANPDIVFTKVDTEVEVRLAQSSNITSIPTLLAFRDGLLVFEEAGALPAAELDSVIQVVRGLDLAAFTAESTRS